MSSALDPFTFLQAVEEFQPATPARPVALATVASLHPEGVSVTFDGEATPTLKRYRYVSEAPPLVGERVAMARVGSSYVILGSVKDTGPAKWPRTARSLWRSTALTLADNTHVGPVTFTTEELAIGDSFGSSLSAFTIPATGVYRLSASLAVDGSSSTAGYVQATITLNSATVTAGSVFYSVGGVKTSASSSGGASGLAAGTSRPVNLSQGDVLRYFAYQRTGDSRDTTVRGDSPTFAVERVG